VLTVLREIRALSTAIAEGKAEAKFSDRPQFIDALIDTIFINPSTVRCSEFFIKKNACLKRTKSTYL